MKRNKVFIVIENVIVMFVLVDLFIQKIEQILKEVDNQMVSIVKVKERGNVIEIVFWYQKRLYLLICVCIKDYKRSSKSGRKFVWIVN